MPKRRVGLRGYVGEAVVAEWLRRRYPGPRFEIVEQVLPEDVPAHGGPYLDLAVVRDDEVHVVVEVKSQDYVWGGDSEVNLALNYLWEHEGEKVQLSIQDDERTLTMRPDARAYLVLLVPPNEPGMKALKKRNLSKVILFEDLWTAWEPPPLTPDSLENLILADLDATLDDLRNPTQGKRLKSGFLQARGSVPLLISKRW